MLALVEDIIDPNNYHIFKNNHNDE